MNHPYFSRRWIIQEVAVARSATLRCGQKLVPWADFSDAVSTLLTNLERVENLFTTHLISPSRSLGDVEMSGANLLLRTTSNLFRRSDDGYVLKPLQSLETLLSTIQPMNVTHSHDLIYSLFSIVNDNRTGDTTPETQSNGQVMDIRLMTCGGLTMVRISSNSTSKLSLIASGHPSLWILSAGN